jgi:antirestriction protein
MSDEQQSSPVVSVFSDTAIKEIMKFDCPDSKFVSQYGCMQSIYEIKQAILEYIANQISKGTATTYEQLEDELDKLSIECNSTYTYALYDNKLTDLLNKIIENNKNSEYFHIWSLVRCLKNNINTNDDKEEKKEKIFLIVLKEFDKKIYLDNGSYLILLNKCFTPKIVSFKQGQINP